MWEGEGTIGELWKEHYKETKEKETKPTGSDQEWVPQAEDAY